jgi:hypothetical protein
MKIIYPFDTKPDGTLLDPPEKIIEGSRVHLYTSDGKSHFIIKEIDGKIVITAFNGRIGVYPDAANMITITEIKDGKIED